MIIKHAIEKNIEYQKLLSDEKVIKYFLYSKGEKQRTHSDVVNFI